FRSEWLISVWVRTAGGSGCVPRHPGAWSGLRALATPHLDAGPPPDAPGGLCLAMSPKYRSFPVGPHPISSNTRGRPAIDAAYRWYSWGHPGLFQWDCRADRDARV